MSNQSGNERITSNTVSKHQLVSKLKTTAPSLCSPAAGTMRSLAVELGPRQIRVNALSPVPLQTRAGSGIAHFDELIDAATLRAPEHCLGTIKDVGDVAVMLASDGARYVSGDIAYVDGGLHVRA